MAFVLLKLLMQADAPTAYQYIGVHAGHVPSFKHVYILGNCNTGDAHMVKVLNQYLQLVLVSDL